MHDGALLLWIDDVGHQLNVLTTADNFPGVEDCHQNQHLSNSIVTFVRRDTMHVFQAHNDVLGDLVLIVSTSF